MSDIAEKLAQAGGNDGKSLPPAKKIREYEGQTLTFISTKTVDTGGRFGPSELATVFTSSGEEVAVWMTGNSGNQLKAVATDLPLDLKVIGFDTDFGVRGYKLELA